MIKTLVVTPEFLNSIINNNELVNKLANRTKKYSAPVYSEVIFLIDNLKSENREEYINISRTHGNHNVNIKYIIEDFLLKLRVEKLPVDENRYATLLLPQGRKGPAFLAFKNFEVYLKWNNSFIYTVTAAHLAKRLAGAKKYKHNNPSDILDIESMIKS